MRHLIIGGSLLAVCLLSSCGVGSSNMYPEYALVLTENMTSITLSGAVDLNGASIEGGGSVTVKVNGEDATMSGTDWTIDLVPRGTYADYRVEYFANGNLIATSEYSLDR